MKESIKEIYSGLHNLSNNDRIIDQKVFQLTSLFNLYLRYRGREEEEEFGKFVKKEIEFEQARSIDKKGT